MNVTVWSNGLEVTGGGTGIVSHAGLGLLRRLADKTGVTSGFSRALAAGRVLGHDRGRVLAGLACAIAGGARAISDFRVLADQAEASGQVASVPTAYRTLEEIAGGGEKTARKLTAAVSTARRHAWSQIAARHGTLPGVRVADQALDGVTCIRIDATVTPAHPEKELAEANFMGFATASCTPPPAWCAAAAASAGSSPRTGPGPQRSPRPSSGSALSRTPPD